MSDQTHHPVMVAEVLSLIPAHTKVIADLTVGGGGHAEAMSRMVGNEVTLLAFDRDVEALDASRKRLAALPNRTYFFHDSYAHIDQLLGNEWIGKVDFALADLGLSSRQLSSSGRGFSFNADNEPIDLRFDSSTGKPLYERLSETPVEELARVLARYGEIGHSHKLADQILSRHHSGSLTTVADLKRIALPFGRREGPNKFLAKIWQALRIWVNDELEQLRQGLDKIVPYLRSHGVLCAISFHSLEDKIVKEFLQKLEKPCICPPQFPQCACGRKPVMQRINKRSITPSRAEVAANPRARSARLRAAVKLGVN